MRVKMELTIRDAKKEDSSKIWEVRSKAIKGIKPEYYTSDEIDAWYNNEAPPNFSEVITKLDWLIASFNDEIVGTGFLDADKAEIGAIFVDPKFQRNGVGLKILNKIEDIAKKKKIVTLFLDATLSAVDFYKAAGYKTTERSKCVLGKLVLSSYKMKKDL